MIFRKRHMWSCGHSCSRSVVALSTCHPLIWYLMSETWDLGWWMRFLCYRAISSPVAIRKAHPDFHHLDLPRLENYTICRTLTLLLLVPVSLALEQLVIFNANAQKQLTAFWREATPLAGHGISSSILEFVLTVICIHYAIISNHGRILRPSPMANWLWSISKRLLMRTIWRRIFASTVESCQPRGLQRHLLGQSW